MINLQSKIAGQSSDQLLPQARSEVLTETTEKHGSGETFLGLMTEFLGMNVDQGSNDEPALKLKNNDFDSFDELLAGKPGRKIEMDLVNSAEGEKRSSSDLINKVQLKDLPDEVLRQLSNLIQMTGGREQWISPENLEKIDPNQLGHGGENHLEKVETDKPNLKSINGLIDGFQIKRSGEKFVLTIPDSNTELTAQEKENIQNQLMKIFRRLSSQAEQHSLKQTVAGITPETDIEIAFASDSKQISKSDKEAAPSKQLRSNNRLGFMATAGSQQGEVKESVNNGNQPADNQQSQKLTLKDVMRLFSNNAETKAEKGPQPQNGSGHQQINSESKESGLFFNSKETSGLLTKNLSSQSDPKLEADVDLSKNLPDDDLKKIRELITRQSETQKTKKVSPAKLVDKSQSKPIQVSSISEITKNDADFKPVVKIETQKIDVNLEFQSQADTESRDREEGKSFVKLNNTSFNQLTKSSGRRDFSTTMIKHLQKQADQSALGTAKNWSQHRFVLESGDSVNVAVRQAEGVMQLQLGAGNSELNKILVQHINEIRQHLQEQMNIDIDLQLQQFGDQQADFNDNNQNSGNGKQESNNGTGASIQHAEAVDGGSKTRTRYLGFNQNEWTA